LFIQVVLASGNIEQTVLIEIDTIRGILFRGLDSVFIYIGAYRILPPQEAAVAAGRIKHVIVAMVRNVLFYKRINYIDQPFRSVKTSEINRIVII
jgi:hypothetical protein